jgi:hypothetical protein
LSNKPKSIKGIPDDLFREAKARAALTGKTIGQFIAEALAEKIHIYDMAKKTVDKD